MDGKIKVVGMGPGSADYFLPAAQIAVTEAEVLIGGSRALAEFARPGVLTKVIDKDIEGVLAFIRAQAAVRRVTVLVSGDPGFYSLLPALRRAFSSEQLEVIPGISSVQLAFARLALPWQGAVLASMHGRSADADDLAYFPGRILGLLTDGSNHPVRIAGLLLTQGWPGDSLADLCARLSYPDEEIVSYTLQTLAEQEQVICPACVMVVREA